MAEIHFKYKSGEVGYFFIGDGSTIIPVPHLNPFLGNAPYLFLTEDAARSFLCWYAAHGTDADDYGQFDWTTLEIRPSEPYVIQAQLDHLAWLARTERKNKTG